MNELKLLKLVFHYSFIDNVDNILKSYTILRKSFDKDNATYIVSINEEKIQNVVNLLMIVTSRQIKVYDITYDDIEEAEVGTDKPLGSKAAIDEN